MSRSTRSRRTAADVAESHFPAGVLHVAGIEPHGGVFTCHVEGRGNGEHVLCLLDIVVAAEVERAAEELEVDTNVVLCGSLPFEVGVAGARQGDTRCGGGICSAYVVSAVAGVEDICGICGIERGDVCVTVLAP